MNRRIIALFSALLMVFAIGASQIQAAAPVAEISIGSYESLSASFETLGKMLDNDQLAVFPKLLEMQLGDNLKAFDKTQPSGALIFLKEQDDEVTGANFFAFIPLSNPEVLFNLIEDNDLFELEDYSFKGVDMKKVTFNDNTVYAVSGNGWTFISNKASFLLKLPKNPAKALGDLPSKYLLAAKVNVDAVPESAKKWIEEQIENGIKAAEMANDEDEDEEEVEDDPASLINEAQKLSQAEQLKQFKKLLYEVKTVVFGTAFDGKKNVLRFDIDVTPVENTDLAAMFESYNDLKCLSNVILDDATAFATQVGVVEESNAKTFVETLGLYKKALLKALADDENVKLDKEKLNSLIEKTSDVIKKLVKANVGKPVQSGAALFVKTDDLGFVATVQGIETDELDQLIKDWIKETAKNADKYFKANTETWKGLTFNVATIPTEEIISKLEEVDSDEAEELIRAIQGIFGDKIEIAYAVGDKTFYFAASKDAVALIKRTADNTNGALPGDLQSYAMLNVQEVLNTFAQFKFIDSEIRDVLDAVASSASEGTGKIWLSSKMTEKGGCVFSLEADGGILKMIQTGVMLYSMNSSFNSDGEDLEFDLDEDE